MSDQGFAEYWERIFGVALRQPIQNLIGRCRKLLPTETGMYGSGELEGVGRSLVEEA
jgi:hypothetical protein